MMLVGKGNQVLDILKQLRKRLYLLDVLFIEKNRKLVLINKLLNYMFILYC